MDFDLINALFELGGACLLTLNIRRLLIDRTLKGVSPWPTAFFSAWGIWNLFFYAAVNTPLSWWAGLLLCVVNLIWLVGVFGLWAEGKEQERLLCEAIEKTKADLRQSDHVVGNEPDEPLELTNVVEHEPGADCQGTCSVCDPDGHTDPTEFIARRRHQWKVAKRKQRAKAKKKGSRR